MVLCLADDATGAMEVGSQFARAGFAVRVVFHTGGRASHTRVIDTESRHLLPEEAYKVVRRAADPSAGAVYKKTDSTLRGNIAAEFRALLDAYPGRPLVYVPAYPALGRTVVGGELLVDGAPLAQSAFARDSRMPVTSGALLPLLGECRVPVVSVPSPAGLLAELKTRGARAVYVCDGSTEEDLQAAAEAVRQSAIPCLAAGPAAFAGYWVVPPAGGTRAARPRAGRYLIVNGSLHPVSRQQVRQRIPEGWRLLSTPDLSTGSPGSAAYRLGREVRQRLEEEPAQGLIVFGGDTLFAVLDCLEVPEVEAGSDVLPGVPSAQGWWKNTRLSLITKAGGFGAPNVLHQIHERLAVSC